jgi:hypothetical protein
MAAITTADVTYTGVDRVVSAPGRVRSRVKLTFPTTNVQYQTGGVPLVSANLGSGRGIVAAVKVIAITASATASMNPLWQWNGSTTAPTLVGLREAAAVADGVAFDELANNFSLTASSQVVTVEVENG